MQTNLPSSPRGYNRDDQNAMRRILGGDFREIASRLQSLEAVDWTPAPPPPPPGNTRLPMGFWNYSDLMGTGPGGAGDTTPPLVTHVTDTSVDPSDVEHYIDVADQYDILLCYAPSRNRGQYIVNGSFSRSAYEGRVRQFQNIAAFADAVARQRVILLLGDEFNHPQFNGTCSPTDVNWMGNLHKSIWPDSLISVRMSAVTLRDGWDSFPGTTADFWTGVDYSWSQRSHQQNNQTLSFYFDNQKQVAASLDMGMIPGLNWWNGGIGVTPIQTANSGVNTCWDMRNDGSSNGILTGENASAPFVRYAPMECGASRTGLVSTIASPAWIRKWADIVSADPDAPFASVWTYPQPGAPPGGEGEAEALAARSDYVAAWNYALGKMNARTQWNGFRTAKPGEPI